MRTFITSDIHFSHKNIMKFCPKSRPFNDIDEMDTKIINIWNKHIGPEDTTYILGDVAFCNAEKAVGYMRRLNGSKILVKGNHDEKLLNDKAFRDCFFRIEPYLETVFEDTKVMMFHYPIYEWNRMHHGAVHFHGHLHGRKIPVDGRIFDVSMDGNDCVPYDMSELIRYVKREPIRKHGDGEN